MFSTGFWAEFTKFVSASAALMSDFSKTDNFWIISDSPIFGEIGPLGELAFSLGVRDPEVRELLGERYRVPLEGLIDVLREYPKGSLGHRWVMQVEKYNLDIDFFPMVPVESPIGWWRQIQREEHDFWHLISDYHEFESPLITTEEELAFQAFQLAQTASPFNLFLLLCGFVYMGIRHPRRFPRFLRREVEAFVRGRRSRSFLAYRWRDAFMKPVDQVVQELNVPPRRVR